MSVKCIVILKRKETPKSVEKETEKSTTAEPEDPKEQEVLTSDEIVRAVVAALPPTRSEPEGT